MKITEDVRKYAAEQGLSEDEAIAKGMTAKSAELPTKEPKFTPRSKL